MDEHRDKWRKFYEKALNRPHSKRTEQAVKLNMSSQKVAVDCGCGTGSDIEYLNSQGYLVHGFDLNPDSIAICRERFEGNSQVHLYESSFDSFNYPKSGVVIANASLFFVEKVHFQTTWKKITSCLEIGGVFVGDFMGKNDSWSSHYNQAITSLTKEDIAALFTNFDIIQLQERDEDGTTMLGESKHWHIYSVVAIKRA